VRSWTSSSKDGVERLHELFEKTYPRFKEFEPQMRAALQLALSHDALDRAGLLKEEPYRRGFPAGNPRERRETTGEGAGEGAVPPVGRGAFDGLWHRGRTWC
jgi:hypothetical protein